MKKLLALAMALTLCLGLAACGGDTADAGTDTTDDTAQTGETVTLRVGATPAPHEEILEQVVDNLAEQGITLEIVPYTDYNTPNTAVEEGEDDANYFQHITYMENFNAEHGTHLVSGPSTSTPTSPPWRRSTTGTTTSSSWAGTWTTPPAWRAP